MFLKIWVNFKTKSLFYKNNNGKGKLVYILLSCLYLLGFPGSSEGKESACNVGDLDSIPGTGRSPGEGNGNPLQSSCPENPMDRGDWWATVHGVAKRQTQLGD